MPCKLQCNLTCEELKRWNLLELGCVKFVSTADRNVGGKPNPTYLALSALSPFLLDVHCLPVCPVRAPHTRVGTVTLGRIQALLCQVSQAVRTTPSCRSVDRSKPMIMHPVVVLDRCHMGQSGSGGLACSARCFLFGSTSNESKMMGVKSEQRCWVRWRSCWSVAFHFAKIDL
jgi:hypothetical protein